MQIKNMFERDIERKIKGVIVVSENQKIKEELDEYVVTKEIAKHLNTFYQNYVGGINKETDRVGVWISGFFGSGKSHFLKILSYILSNELIDGKRPIEYFENKIEDKLLYADMEKAARVNSETILFNIDSKNPDKDKTNAILYTFLKVFNERRGFSGEKPGLAEFEKMLVEEGIYESFKIEFEKITNKVWVERRNAYKFDAKKIAQALVNVSENLTEEAALGLINNINDYKVSIEDFAKEVKKYIDTKEDDFHLIFLVDEVGQFIGDNSELMVNLQTVVEDLRKTCKGKVWVVVTAQESIDEIVKVKGDDFSKIQGRFDTKLSLSSVSVDEVIKKRILGKTPQAVLELKEVYNKEEYTLKNLLKFDKARSDLLGYSNEKEFVSVYPFIPYQFNLLQSVFEEVRKHGNSGKNLSKGERSMLEAFQASAADHLDKNEEILIPFDAFYETISVFLNPTITRVIERASKNPALEDDSMNLRVLKVLFMLKHIGEIPENIENITTLLITNMHEKRSDLEPKIREALRKLERENLIQKDIQNEIERYIFLTDDEQDVNREINNIKIDEEEIRKEIGGYIFNDLYDTKKYRYEEKYDFEINRKVDDKDQGRQIGYLGINILTHMNSEYNSSKENLSMKSISNKEIIIKLANNDKYIELIESYLKIKSYDNKINENNIPDNIKPIIENKRYEITKLTRRAKELIEDNIKNADFIVNGNEELIKGTGVKDKLNKALEISTKKIYKYIDQVKNNIVNEKDIENILNISSVAMTMGDINFEEVNGFAIRNIKEFIDINKKEVSMKEIIDRYIKPEYGWRILDIQGIIAVLFKNQEIKIRHKGIYLNITDYKKIASTLVSSIEKENIMISIRTKVDANLIKDVKNIAHNLFDNINLYDDEDLLAKSIKDEIGKELEDIKKYLAKYDGNKYPGKSRFEKGKELFSQFKYNTDNIPFFEKFRELEFDLIDCKEIMSPSKDFFNNQKDKFDIGTRTIKRYENNKDYIQDINLKENAGKLQSILNDSDPYRKIKDIQDLVNAIDSSINKAVKENKEEAVDKIKEIQQTLLEKADAEGVTDTTKQTIEEAYLRYIYNIKEYNDIVRINSTLYTCTNRINDFELKIEREINSFKSKQNLINEPIETSTSVNEPEVEVKKPMKKVKISKVVNKKYLLSENDVEEYIRELELQLKKLIKEDKEIQLID